MTVSVEIVDKNSYDEYESFVMTHPKGELMQSVAWRYVKTDWDFEAVAVRDASGAIVGACSVLIKKVPFVGTTYMYAPRGPICDWHNSEVLAEIKQGFDILAKKYRAQSVKVDPYCDVSDTKFLEIMQSMGFKRFYDPVGFDTIQARFNYVLDIRGKTKEQIVAEMAQKARYNLNLSYRKGVTVAHEGKEALDDFMRIYKLTGERDGFSTRPKQYLERLIALDGVRLYIGRYEGEAICGAICSCYAGKCSYIYGASDSKNRNLMPNYPLQLAMIEWALENNCSTYDFMGIAGDIENTKNPMYGLYRFKKGFSGQIVELVGELDYSYKPFLSYMLNLALKIKKGR